MHVLFISKQKCVYHLFSTHSEGNSLDRFQNTPEMFSEGKNFCYSVKTFPTCLLHSKKRFVPPVTISDKINLVRELKYEEEVMKFLQKPYITEVKHHLIWFYFLQVFNCSHKKSNTWRQLAKVNLNIGMTLLEKPLKSRFLNTTRQTT